MPLSDERIKYLLESWSEGRCLPNEEQELFEWVTGDDKRLLLDSHVNNIVQYYSNSELSKAVDWEKLYDRILVVRENQPPNHQYIESYDKSFAPIRRIGFLHGWGWAAAIVIVFGLSAYLFYRSVNDSKPSIINSVAEKQIYPGGNKATLTLSDGTVIALDNAAPGAIARQGKSSISKLTDGQIKYDQQGSGEGNVMMNTMSTPRGGQYQLTLPDGTRVWLNAASSITYPAVFVGKQRKVKINGEVYFEVAKNKEKPFIVDVDGKSTVQVLGTSFNVNSYSDEEVIRATLVEGSVKVLSGNTNVILKPGQQAQISGTDGISVSSSADIEQTLAWKNGIFNFNGLDVRTVMAQLSRWYDVTVRYEGSIPKNIFRGEMYRDVKLSTVLKTLSEMGIKYKMEGKTIIVTQ